MDEPKTFSFATSMAEFAADIVQALHKMEKCFGPDFLAKPGHTRAFYSHDQDGRFRRAKGVPRTQNEKSGRQYPRTSMSRCNGSIEGNEKLLCRRPSSATTPAQTCVSSQIAVCIVL
jgi:hypothetical protein